MKNRKEFDVLLQDLTPMVPHDYLNKPYWYDQTGNIIQGTSRGAQFVGNAANFYNLLLATPFAAASVMPSHSYSFLEKKR